MLTVLLACRAPVPMRTPDSGDTASAPFTVPGGVRLDIGGPVLGGPDVVVGEDGEILAAWIEGDHPRETTAVVVRSTDGGRTFSPPTPMVPADAHPTASWPRRIRLAIDDQRVVAAMSILDPYGVLPLVGIYESPRGEPAFHELVVEPAAPDYEGLIYPVIRLLPDGAAAVAMLGLKDISGDYVYALESDGWGLRTLPADGDAKPCSCCPVELSVSPSGLGLLAWRGFEVRDIWVAPLDLATITVLPAERATSFGWEELVCPLDGPVVAPAPDGDGDLLAWMDHASSDALPQIFLSERRGGEWSAPSPADASGEPQERPHLATRLGGGELVYETSLRGPSRTGSWSGRGFDGFEGVDGLAQVAVAATASGFVEVGVGTDDSVWLVQR